MTRGVEALLEQDSIKQTKELFQQQQKDKLIQDFMSSYFNENNVLTPEGQKILEKLKMVGDNQGLYLQTSQEFKTHIMFNLEKYRKNPQENEDERKTDIINRGIEAEYSYINQNRFGEKAQLSENKEFDGKNLNTFAKMQLTDVYELCAGNNQRKTEFIQALMKNDKNIYQNEYYALLATQIRNQVPQFTQNMYASNGETPYHEVDNKNFFEDIWNYMTSIAHEIKSGLETGVWLASNIGDLVKKSFQDGEKKEKGLIQDFNEKYDMLSQDLKTADDKETGFSGSIIQNKETGVKTLLIRGSDDPKDWLKNNTHIVMRDKLPPQVESVVRFIQEAKEKGIIKQGEKINIVGHSLGGGLAQITSMMYRDDVKKTYTFNAPGVAGITTDIDTNDEIVKKKVEDYKKQLDNYKKLKENNPNFEENFILNIRNNDKVGNFDDKNHIGLTTGQVDGFSHFLDTLNASIYEMSIEDFNDKFKDWIDQFNKIEQ